MDDMTEGEALAYTLTLLRGIHAETRAARLEAKGRAGKLSPEEAEDLKGQLTCCDEIAHLFSEEDAPCVGIAS